MSVARLQTVILGASAAALLWAGLPLTPAGADNLTTYRFEENDGTVWFTDHKPRGVNFDQFTFLGYHGRAPAVASCRITRSTMETRASIYEHRISRYAEHYGVSPLLIRAIVSVESCFDRLAKSSAGAQGLMQLMPATALELGVSNVWDADQNLRGGIRYFSDLQRRYRHNNKLALAAYNAGPGAVERYNGVPPYRETQHYVTKVLKRYREYLQD